LYCYVAADILNELIATLSGNNNDDSVEVDNDYGLPEDKNSSFNPTSLLDLSAKIVAKYCSSSVLEYHEPPLDESLLRKVGFIIYHFTAFAS
jgi:hypothetical protein